MSVRHQIEILYQDYLDMIAIKNVSLFREVEGGKEVKVGRYRFNEIVDGFQSYLEKDELAMDRSSLLEDVKSLEKLSKVGQNKDLFKDFVECYHTFLVKVIALSNGWSFPYDDEDLIKKIPQPF